MVMAAIAALGALGTIAGAGASIAGQMGRGNNDTADRQYNLQVAQLQDAKDNEAYQRAVSAMINQRSVAGQEDDQGSSLMYDPATNTWRSTLGALPKAAQIAADQASISRNTTDVGQAQLANALAARRAGQAGPVADTAIRELQSFRPQSQGELVGLLQKQATNAANATFAPLRADTLRSFQRSGTAAGPVLAQLGKTENDALRDSLIDAQIKGMTSVGGLNQSRRQGLEQSAANAYTLSNPTFQYPGLSPRTDDMDKIIAARAQAASTAPYYGGANVNAAAVNTTKAGGDVKVPLPSNSLETAGKSLSSLLSDKDLASNIEKAYKGFFGPSSSGDFTQSSNPLLDYGQQAANIESRWAQNQSGGFGNG